MIAYRLKFSMENKLFPQSPLKNPVVYKNKESSKVKTISKVLKTVYPFVVYV